MRVLFASDYFKPSLPEEMYREEAACFRNNGVVVSTVNTDSLESSKLIPMPESGERVLYRGWMLNMASYKALCQKVSNSGASMVSGVDSYLQTHPIPNWYPLLSEYTAETVILPNGTDFESELKQMNWAGFFVKDYVKSLKTSVGSVVTDPSEVPALIGEMEKFRGEIEGGLCVRRLEEYRPETETRYFVISGRAYAADGEAVPAPVRACAERISSEFFSVDVAERADGELRIVEIGDGQVSDTTGWQIEDFVGRVCAALVKK